MVSLDGRLRRIEQRQRAPLAQGPYAPEFTTPFDYDLFEVEFDHFWQHGTRRRPPEESVEPDVSSEETP